MTDKKMNVPSKASDLSDEEIDIAQWRVDVTKPGRWKIEEIYAEYWEDQPNKKLFGKRFKAAVKGGRIKGVSALKHDNGEAVLSGDHHQLYEKI